MKPTQLILPCIFLIFLLQSCSKEKTDAALALNNDIVLPAGSFQIEESQTTVDSGIKITQTNAPPTNVDPETQININITFTSANSDVTHAGIRFGENGQIWCIPISGANGNSRGTLTVPMQIPSGICQQVSEICHDVRCYEFAIAQDGNDSYRISNSNINDVILGCGGCEEPSCQSFNVCNCSQDNLLDRQNQLFVNLDFIETDFEYCQWLENEYFPFFEYFTDCLQALGATQQDVNSLKAQIDALRDEVLLENGWSGGC